MRGRISIGVVGDLHGYWDDADVRYFNETDYELLLFTGDLGSGTGSSGVNIAKSLARLRRPTLVIGGNNDVRSFSEISAELTHQRGLARILDTDSVTRPSGLVELSAYRVHPIPEHDLTVVVGRPYSLGGPELTFVEALDAQFSVASMDASRDRLVGLMDEAPTTDIVVLSHNGPTGLGATRHDIWGCDFQPGEGDWGDPDLEAAIAYARRIGKRVRAVIAGHMHLKTKDGAERVSGTVREATLYLNAARVPRIARDGARHHLSLEIDADHVAVVGVEAG